MKRFGCAGIALVACVNESPREDDVSTGGTTTGGGIETTAGAGDATTEDSTGEEDALQVCRDLPAAAAANWQEGVSVPPTGESTSERIADAGRQTWAVALDLLRVTPADQSIAMSPTSMSVALGISYSAYEGDECGDKIHSIMHFAEAGNSLHQTFGAGILELEARALPAAEDEYEPLDPVVLSLRQSIWHLQDAEDPGPPAYGATVHFVKDGEIAAIREVMNCVIEVQSHGLLKAFVPEGFPKEDTTRFDVNVAFLQAPWAVALEQLGPFEFHREDGEVVLHPGIGGEIVDGDSYEDEQLVAFELPLRGGKLGVMLILPAASDVPLADFIEGLTLEALTDIRDAAAPETVDFRMPKVDVATGTIDYYPLLGFDCEMFKLRTVLHGAAVQIDEHGIKAATATVPEHWDEGSGGDEADRVLHVDRPFLFFVYDRPTGFVLYSGRFMG